MLFKSWGEMLFDVAIGAGIYYVAKNSGKNEVQQKWNDCERDKQIVELQRQIEQLKLEKK